MTIQELQKKYTQSDLVSCPGNKELRYKLFAPIIQNLHESKIIYRERFIVIAKVESLIITPERLEAKVVPYLKIYEGEENYKYTIPESWTFSAGWDWVSLIDSKLCVFGVWTIWCDPKEVKNIEQLALNNQTEKALNILYEKE